MPATRFLRRSQMLLALALAASLSAAHAQDGYVRQQMAYPTGDPAGSILLLERIAPASVRTNSEFEYVLRLTNLTVAEIRGIVLSETPSPDLEIRDVQPGGRQTGRQMNFRVNSLAPRGSAEVRVRAVARRVGEVTGCATITLSAEACSAIRVVEPALQLAKAMPPEVMACDLIPIRLVVSNPGSGVATNVRIVDPLPEGWTLENGAGDLVANVGDLPPGQSREVNVRARASSTGSFTNRAVAQADGGLEAQATAGTRIVIPRLELVKSGPSVRFLGRPAEFSLSVSNTGDAVANDVVIVDNLPPQLRFTSASDGGRFEGGRVVWRLGALRPGENRQVALATVASQVGDFRNTATAQAYCAEAAAELVMRVEGVPAILLEVIDLEDPDEVGTTETYVITVTNQGTANDTGIIVTATVQPEATFVTAEGPTGATADGRNVVFAPLPSLAPRAKAIYKVTVRGDQPGDTRFSVQMVSDNTKAGDPVQETESTRFY